LDNGPGNDQFSRYLVNSYRSFRIFEVHEKSSLTLDWKLVGCTKTCGPSNPWKAEHEMNQNQILSMEAGKEIKRIEINVERVVIWALVLTNLFSISYFFAKLFKWV
jgi:hypothetical protein